MTKEEFVEAYGELVWKKLVEPMQYNMCRCFRCQTKRQNANVLVFAELENIRKKNASGHEQTPWD